MRSEVCGGLLLAAVTVMFLLRRLTADRRPKQRLRVSTIADRNLAEAMEELVEAEESVQKMAEAVEAQRAQEAGAAETRKINKRLDNQLFTVLGVVGVYVMILVLGSCGGN